MAGIGAVKQQKITKRQQDILMLVYLFRFLNRTQIQTLLRHKDKKTINMWLRDLKEKNYLEWSYSKKFIENTKPAVYFSGLGAVRYLKTRSDVNENSVRSLYRDGSRSQDFRTRKLMAAEVAAWCSQREGYDYLTPPSYLVPGSAAHFLRYQRVEPDLVLLRTSQSGIFGFMLMILGYSWPRWRVMSEIRNYIDLYLSNAWEDQMRISFPKIVIACRSRGQLGEVKRYVKRQLEAQENPDDLVFEVVLETSHEAHKVRALLAN
jgi:hypothetical protein